MTTTKAQLKAAHRRLTRLGAPRTKDGNRLGLRKRRAMLAEEWFQDRRDAMRAAPYG